MDKPRRQPERMCVACREMKEKSKLFRVVKSPDGIITLDDTGKSPGRGAYICRCITCVKTVRRSHALERVLKVKISPDIYDLMELKAENSGDG